MGFWEKLRVGIARFMMGRNGMDALNRALLWAYVGLYFVRILMEALTRSLLAGRFLGALYTLSALVLLFRLLSRNLPRRQEENEKWLAAWGEIRRWGVWDRIRRTGLEAGGRIRRLGSALAGRVERQTDRRHKYFTCQRCGAVCRVPAGKGKILITCPRCGAQMEGKT